MFHLIGYSSQIYINTKSASYQAVVGGEADQTTYVGTAAVHERSHRDGTLEQRLSEGRAYTEQLRVLQKFGPGVFKSREFYDNAEKFVKQGSQRKD